LPSRSEVNRLGDRIREHGLTGDDRALLLEYRASFLPAYESVTADIQRAIPERRLTGRPEKTPDSIVAKLRRTKIELARMQDIAGCRLIVSGIEEQDMVVGTLADLFSDVRVVDRRTSPAAGYRAVHVIPTVDGRQVEIQVRTDLQHRWADLSEQMADAFGSGLKYGNAPAGVEPILNMLMRSSEMLSVFETSSAEQSAALDERLRTGVYMGIIAIAMEDV
jgi:ppGpp synthetase/RelA/SpoT-type nucleotidyltranferase